MSKIITEHPEMRTLSLPGTSPVAYCGIAVKAGTRNEGTDEHGLAHLCEHLSFKGTARRTATQIINAIEGLGGELNAFTNKEDTVYYCAIQRQHVRRALDVLQDIVFCSTYPQHEVEKEREVVCEEIESYEDTPSELIYDEFENILFDGHPLGHNILGTAERVRSFSGDDAKSFTSRWYKPENCVMFVSGVQEFRSLGVTDNRPAMEKVLSATPELLNSCNSSTSSTVVIEKGTHQAHVMLGTVGYAAADSRRWALYLLNNILGGPAMNSRLNMSLRERRGLVYTVESTMACYSDTGLWSVYFGCDAADVDRCCRLVRRELDAMMEKPLSDARLRAAKRQLQGQLAIANENREQVVIDSARNFLHTGRVRSISDVMKHIDALTADDLLLTAQQLFVPERITTLVYK